MLRILLRVLLCCLAVVIPAQLFATPLAVEHIWHNRTFPVDNHNYKYISYLDFFDVTDAGTTNGVWIADPNGPYGSIYPGEFSWGHTLPPHLSVPPDEVTRAMLYIDASFVDEANNLVEIEGTWNWNLVNHLWEDNTTFDLSNVTVPGFWNSSPLNVSVFAGERKLKIDHAALAMDYRSASIPEPATFALFGLGMAGVGFIRRKK